MLLNFTNTTFFLPIRLNHRGGHPRLHPQGDHVVLSLSDFESVNNGRDIGFTVKQSRVSTPRNHKELVTRSNSYTLVTVRKHGQAEVLVHTKHVNNFSRNHSVISGFVKYLCDTDSNSSTQAVSFYNV